MSFFSELKRRNVFRIATAYAIAAWLLLQIADLVLDNTSAPPWVIQSLFVIVGVGFVFALIFSWLYELTPEGVMKESAVPRERSITYHTAKKLDYLTIALLVGAVAYLVVDRYVLEAPVAAKPTTAKDVPAGTPADIATTSSADTLATSTAASATSPTAVVAAPSAEPNSIAVLPFSDLSEGGDQAYFSDGIAEELLNLLVRVDGLKVASRTSSFAYKGESRSIPEIAAELKVANILEGSVRKAGNRVRITAQLIDTRNDRHLWSETYDRDLVDIFAIQDEIATAIVSALKDQLGVQAASDAIEVEAATGNLDAYDLYLKGRNLFVARQDLDVAIDLFEQAIALDPNYARAWEGLAAAESVADDWLLGDGIDHGPLGIKAAQRAMELDPELSMPYAVLGNSEGVLLPGKDVPDLTETLRLLDLAIENDPNNTTAWQWRGNNYVKLGFFDRAVTDFDECLRLDPAYLNCVQHRAAALLFSGDTDAALAAFIPTLYENFHSMDEAFVAVLVQQGNSLAALLLATARLKAPYAPVGEWIKALEHPDQDHRTGLARFDRWAAEYHNNYASDFPDVLLAFGDYERAVQSPSLRFGFWGPGAKAFRQTPWFKQYMRKLGVEDYWRKHGFPPSCTVVNDQEYTCD
jgi:TolB-like protein